MTVASTTFPASIVSSISKSISKCALLLAASSPMTTFVCVPNAVDGSNSRSQVSAIGLLVKVSVEPSIHDAPAVNVPPLARQAPPDMTSMQLPLGIQQAPMLTHGSLMQRTPVSVYVPPRSF